MSTRRSRTKRTTTKVVQRLSQLDHLVVIRESARYDYMLMLGMIQQTLAKVSHLPGAIELMAAGMDIFDNPSKWGATVRRTGDSTMAMIEREGVLYLYSMGTAAKNDLPGTNAFVHELVQIIETYRPVETWVVAFTRLLRSANYVGNLLTAFSEHTRVLHCEAEINIATPEGRMLFQVLAMIAATERDYMVRRHTAGRVAQWRRGEWISNAYPPGYQLEGGKLVLDESKIEATRRMLVILSDIGLTPAVCAERIGALGVVTPMIERLHGPEATISDARNPTEAIDTLVGWVDLYNTGVYEMLWPNPFPGVSDIAGLVVEDLPDYAYGALRFVQSVPVPEGGWADEATINAVKARGGSDSLTGGAGHRMTPPLSGLFKFSDDTHEYALTSVTGYYKLLRRALLDDRLFDGWASENGDDAEWLASVSRLELHQSIADGVLAAVRDGLPAELDANRFQSSGPLPQIDPRRARLRGLNRQLEDSSRALVRARRNAELAEDDKAAQLFVDDVKRHYAGKTRLEREIATLEDELDEPELGQTFETNADLVAHAIAALSNVESIASSDLRDALRTVISNERWFIDGDYVRWDLSIELPHPDGTVTLGPISGRVLNRHIPSATVPSTKDRVSQKLLVENGLCEAASYSATACPSPVLSTVLMAHLSQAPLDQEIDPEWADHIVATYADLSFAWNRGKWRLPDEGRRALLSLLSDAGGQLSQREILATGITKSQLRYLGRVTDAPSGQPIVRRAANVRNAMYTLIECPHCGGFASHSIVTPETPLGVLCPSCWRMPVALSPVFPEMYRIEYGLPVRN